ncbi:MAG: hypothetical protein HY532_04065, partial [Chloroflexi bacterium]|nr:hypothetical protein [Chloroflexota bacterium]
MTTLDPQEIKEVVRQRYAAIATGAAACCDDASNPEAPPKGVYIGTDLTHLP